MRTVYPTSRPSFEEWVKEFNVSRKYVDKKLQAEVLRDDAINYNRFNKKRKKKIYEQN